MERIRTLIGKIVVSVREEAKAPVGIIFGMVFAVFLALVGLPEAKKEEWVGPSGPAIFGAIEYVLIIAILSLLLWLLVRISGRLRPSSDPVPRLQRSDFKCRVLDRYEDSLLINDHLVQRIFPDGSIDRDQALKAQEKNPCRLVGLIDGHTDNIVGWSSLWPVTATAGRAIETGTRLDDDLTVDDLLPMAENGQAEYLILLSFGVLPEYRDGRECPGRKLGRFALSHIIDEFLVSSGRSIRMVAVAYTKEGERLCELLGLVRNGKLADYGSKHRKKPTFAGRATVKKLCRRLCRFLGLADNGSERWKKPIFAGDATIKKLNQQLKGL